MQCSKQRGRGAAKTRNLAGLGRAACLAVVCAVVAGCSSAAKTPDPALLQALQRGVNLGDWWTDSAGSSVIRADHHPTHADYAEIRRLGFGHVRVPVASFRLAEGGGRFSATKIDALRANLEDIIAADLAVIVALQMNVDEKRALVEDAGLGAAFARDWALLAESLAELPADKLVLELLNEPTTEDAEAWQALQRKILAAVRKAAPRHTAMLTGAHYADLDDLERLRPVADRNVIYSFHFYTPHNFTHQGADWGWAMWSLLSGLPYPAEESAIAAALDAAPKPARDHIRQYGRESWDKAALSAELSRARMWADEHDVLIHCTEFGAIGSAPPDGRLRWLSDVRSTLEQNQTGWTLWDYAGRFAIAEPAEPVRSVPQAILQALGLP